MDETKDPDLRNRAVVRPWGSVLLGSHIRCDGDGNGNEFDRRFACFSHIHNDHIQGFESALTQCHAVLITPQTKELLIAKLGEYLKIKSNLFALNYGEQFTHSALNGDTITFFDSGHILGSCQILVETKQGYRILYSGDFNMPGAYIPSDVDVLILDSTHGEPLYDYEVDKNKSETKIISLVKEELEKLKPVIIRSARGKMQYLMHLITCHTGRKIPLVAKDVDVRLSKVYQKYGFNCGEIIADASDEFHRILKRDEPYIRFFPMSGPLPCELQKVRSIRVGLHQEYHIEETNMFQVNLSDHASFSGIMKYVKAISPKTVITDNSERTGGNTAIILANEIKRNLDIPAFHQPL